MGFVRLLGRLLLGFITCLLAILFVLFIYARMFGPVGPIPGGRWMAASRSNPQGGRNFHRKANLSKLNFKGLLLIR